jgi:hypothetical protein
MELPGQPRATWCGIEPVQQLVAVAVEEQGDEVA